MARRRNDAGRATAGIMAAVLAMLLVLLVLLSSIFGAAGARTSRNNRYVFSTEITAAGPLRFSEVMTSNESYFLFGMTSLPDWIELQNTSDREVSIKDWSVMRASDPSEVYPLPDVTVAARGYLVLIADGHTEKTTDSELHLPFKLPGSGDTLVLMDPNARTVDSVAVPSMEKGLVYARDDAGIWTVSTTPTAGEPNLITAEAVESAATTAPEELTVAQDQVYVTEIMTANASYVSATTGRCYDYIEIYNSASFDVSLKGWSLSNDRTQPQRWQFPDDASIPAGDRLLVYCGGAASTAAAGSTDALIADFRLSSGGCQVLLSRSDGQCISLIDVPALRKDQAYSLINGRWTGDYAPTPGMANDRSGAIAQDAELCARNTTGITINEIAAATTTMDYDWVELYNSGSSAVDLSGWGLSDNTSKPRKWQFPQGTVIEPGAYFGVFCSGLDKVSGNTMHTSFKLSKDGGYNVVLATPDGTIVDRIYLSTQFTNISVGRRPDAQGIWFFTESTPLAANTTAAYAGKASAPAYSVPGGLYKTGDTLSVELIVSEPDLRIYYTTDNTDPTEASTLYTGPIPISGTTVLRTRVYGNGYLESYMDTQTYLYDVNNGDGVYVVSLVSDPDNLTGNENGIMIKGANASSEYPYKGANFWQDWEREAHVEIFAGDGSQVLSSECGIKLHGQFSRAEDQQAFKVIARSKYGNSRFDAALFSRRPYTSYQSFLLRAAGQDCNMAHMRDPILQQLASDTSVMYQEYEVAVLYLDGQYWGLYYLRERINTASICQFENWPGQEDNLDLVKANRNTMQGSNETFADLVEWAKNTDPTTDAFYEHVDEQIDIQNYIEYMSVEIFVGNGDTLNVKRYRNANADGKWRWVLFDLDWAFYVDTDSINRWLTPGGMGTSLYTDNSFFINCMKNPTFRDRFLTYMGQRMATVYTTSHTLELFQSCYNTLQPMLPEQLQRWNQSESDYASHLKKLINYCKTRPGRLIEFFSGTKYLNLTAAEMQKYFGDAIALINSESTT